jgi:hypothetical protein
MRRERTKQSLKLRLLAFVLTLALVWYSLDPAPKPVTRKKREAEPPDEKRRNIEHQSMPATLLVVSKPLEKVIKALPSFDKEVDDFDWPEFIDG